MYSFFSGQIKKWFSHGHWARESKVLPVFTTSSLQLLTNQPPTILSSFGKLTIVLSSFQKLNFETDNYFFFSVGTFPTPAASADTSAFLHSPVLKVLFKPGIRSLQSKVWNIATGKTAKVLPPLTTGKTFVRYFIVNELLDSVRVCRWFLEVLGLWCHWVSRKRHNHPRGPVTQCQGSLTLCQGH